MVSAKEKEPEAKRLKSEGAGVKPWSFRLILIYSGLIVWLLCSWAQAGPSVFSALAYNLAVLMVLVAFGSITRTVSIARLTSLFLWGGFLLGAAVVAARLIGTICGQAHGLAEVLSASTEEAIKVVPILIVLFAGRRFSSWTFSVTDLLLMGAAIGAGYSFVQDAFAHPTGAWPGQLRFLPTVEIVNGRMVVGQLLWTALSAVSIGFGLLLRSRGRLAYIIGAAGLILAIVDHAAFRYGQVHGDWFSSILNFMTANGYIALIVFCLLSILAFIADIYVQSRTLPRFSEFSLPTGLEGLDGLQALWEFTLDRRRLGTAMFQFESAEGAARKPVAFVVSLLTQTLINGHSRERRMRSWELLTDCDITISPGMEPGLRSSQAQSMDFEDSFEDLDLPEHYRVIAPISEGGMGVIFRAHHVHTGSKLAIKVLHPTIARQATAVERFKQEAKAVGSLNHPNLVVVTDFGITDRKRIPFLVMELIPGISLDQAIKESSFIPLDRFYDIFDQVTDALAHAHKRWVIHRDLKPSNILLSSTDDKREIVKIVDFGIAKLMSDEMNTQELTRTGDLIGSPLYMSPEQGLGTILDARSDIYSLGCVMYECLTGHPPFIGANAVQTIMKHVNEQPIPIRQARPDSAIPAALDDIIVKCLEKDPGNRFQSMEQLRSALQAVRHSQKVDLQQENTQDFKTLAGILNPGLFRKK